MRMMPVGVGQSKKLSKKGKLLYIVLHVEIMGGYENLRADEMVFHVASSLEKAARNTSRRGMARLNPYSWWEMWRFIRIRLMIFAPLGITVPRAAS